MNAPCVEELRFCYRCTSETHEMPLSNNSLPLGLRLLNRGGQLRDLRFADLMGEALGEVARVYVHFGWPFTEELRQRMRAFLDTNPRGKHGAHRYTLEDFQLTPDVVKERFAPYIEHFDLNAN